MSRIKNPKMFSFAKSPNLFNLRTTALIRIRFIDTVCEYTQGIWFQLMPFLQYNPDKQTNSQSANDAVQYAGKLNSKLYKLCIILHVQYLYISCISVHISNGTQYILLYYVEHTGVNLYILTLYKFIIQQHVKRLECNIAVICAYNNSIQY